MWLEKFSRDNYVDNFYNIMNYNIIYCLVILWIMKGNSFYTVFNRVMWKNYKQDNNCFIKIWETCIRNFRKSKSPGYQQK